MNLTSLCLFVFYHVAFDKQFVCKCFSLFVVDSFIVFISHGFISLVIKLWSDEMRKIQIRTKPSSDEQLTQSTPPPAASQPITCLLL